MMFTLTFEWPDGSTSVRSFDSFEAADAARDSYILSGARNVGWVEGRSRQAYDVRRSCGY